MPVKADVEIDLAPAERILESVLSSRPAGADRILPDDLIPILQQVQEAFGYLPPAVLGWISERSGIPTSRMYGVITFYAQFYLEPHGKHTVICCRGTACHVRGGKKVINAAKSLLAIEEGGTTGDMLFSLETVACLGACALSPVMVVDKVYYGKMSPRRAEQILQQLVQREKG